jgi:uncharacterized C2H2 Zn-finger protein
MRRNHEAEAHRNFETAEFALGYLYRNVEEQLNDFATKNGGKVSIVFAAQRVGELLLAKARGSVLDGVKRLSKVRRHAANGDEVSAAKTEVHVRPRNGGALKFPSSKVTCKVCGKVNKNRRAYMLHRNTAHPEEKQKQENAMRKAKGIA